MSLGMPVPPRSLLSPPVPDADEIRVIHVVHLAQLLLIDAAAGRVLARRPIRTLAAPGSSALPAPPGRAASSGHAAGARRPRRRPRRRCPP